MRADASPFLASYGDALADDPMARSELRGWCALAILSLAVAGVFALLLALSRTPGVGAWVPWPAAFFGKGLVVHVVFAFIVWFLAVLGAFLTLAAWRVAGGRPPLAVAGRVGLALAAVACVLLFVPALLDRGEPTLNNYVPAIIDPLYYAGLGVLALGLTLPVARLLVAPVARLGVPLDDLAMAALGAAVVFCLALVCFGLAYGALAGQAVLRLQRGTVLGRRPPVAVHQHHPASRRLVGAGPLDPGGRGSFRPAGQGGGRLPRHLRVAGARFLLRLSAVCGRTDHGLLGPAVGARPTTLVVAPL